MLLNKEKVLEVLPHRDPFLFIDSVESVKIPGVVERPGEKYFELKDLVGAEVVAHYRTKKEHVIFQGHFPDYPIFPGVTQVETMAQASSFFILLGIKDMSKMKMDVALTSIENAKFRKPVLPEMDLRIETKLEKVRGPMIYTVCKLYHQDVLMSEATVMASIKMIAK